MQTLPTIIIDTREQTPFLFPGQRTLKRKLKYGDYALQGLISFLVIERKSLPDLFGTISIRKNFERFKRELEGLRKVRFAFILIEGTSTDVLNGFSYSNANGGLLMDKLFRTCLEYDVMLIFGGARPMCERVALALLRAAVEFQEVH